MTLSDFEKKPPMSRALAKQKLIHLLRCAHAGERAAANAYWGHARSFFVTDIEEKREIVQIFEEEVHHRSRLFQMLKGLDARPHPFREFLMNGVGRIIGFLCLFGGWFIPMYGAAKLECENMQEYETAARLAYLAGADGLVDELLTFAEVEWDHELYFRKKAQSHWMFRFVRQWKEPPPRESVLSSFEAFKQKVPDSLW